MAEVILALAEVGFGVQLEDLLAQAGVPARWMASVADGPRGAAGVRADAIILDGDHLGNRLVEIAAAWRRTPGIPGLLAVGRSAIAVEQAALAKVTLVAPSASAALLRAAIEEAMKLRLAVGLSWPLLRAAVNLPLVDISVDEAGRALVLARRVDADVPRAALRWYANHYATATAAFQELRDARVLTVPEMQLADLLDGTLTLQTMLRRTSLDAYQALRVLWALACVGAVALTPEPHDVATIPRRLLVDIRSHLRARANRLMASTFYDVLEIPPAAEQAEIEAAFQLVARRYAPPILAAYDLSDLASQVQPQWDVTEKARAVLLDNAARGRYHDWMREKGAALRTIWAVPAAQARQAAAAFGRGQKALGDGDVHKAMSELAAACRAQPGHPEYETNLAWARYRVEVNAGKDRDTVARRERATVEDTLWGLRPWPRALLALAMLCAACSDPDAARWYLRQALEVDPTMPAALQLWQRLAGTRR